MGHKLWRAVQNQSKRSTPPPIETATVERVQADGYYAVVLRSGQRVLAPPTTDEPHRAGDRVLVSRVSHGGYVVHGKDR